jgi:cation:H+ antiporter
MLLNIEPLGFFKLFSAIDIPVEIFLMAFGFILLIKGGDWFVDASVGIAKKFGLPELLIGATVVSIGTTLPEVLTSVFAAIGNNGGIAYGNAIGSIICNTALICSITIAVKPGKADKRALIFPVAAFFTVAAFYAINAYFVGSFARWAGIVLLVCFLVYMVINVLSMKKEPKEEEEGEALEISEVESGSIVKHMIMLVVGAATIAIGASLLATNAESVAINYLHIDPVVVGVTVVALGTSLPELVTAITSLMKGHGSLSLGNIIGANIFNLVLVSGAAITISPFPLPSGLTINGIPASLIIDIPLVFITMGILTIPTIIKGKLSRWQGIALLVVYAGFIASQAILGFMPA